MELSIGQENGKIVWLQYSWAVGYLPPKNAYEGRARVFTKSRAYLMVDIVCQQAYID